MLQLVRTTYHQAQTGPPAASLKRTTRRIPCYAEASGICRGRWRCGRRGFVGSVELAPRAEHPAGLRCVCLRVASCFDCRFWFSRRLFGARVALPSPPFRVLLGSHAVRCKLLQVCEILAFGLKLHVAGCSPLKPQPPNPEPFSVAEVLLGDGSIRTLRPLCFLSCLAEAKPTYLQSFNPVLATPAPPEPDAEKRSFDTDKLTHPSCAMRPDATPPPGLAIAAPGAHDM